MKRWKVGDRVLVRRCGTHIVDLFADYCPGLSIGSLYAGIDGLALGVQLATGARVAWHAEIDPDGGCAGGSPGKGIITAIGAAVMPMRAAIHAAPVDFFAYLLIPC